MSSDQSRRWRVLLDALAERRRLSVTEAAELLEVSQATIRRDFKELDRQQLATRTHGGVEASSVAYSLPARYRVNGEDPRERIAAAAANLITAGQVVGFNGGTTTTAIARRLGQRTAEPGFGDVTVVTNALNIAAALVLRPSVRTICLGGEARPESYELFGPVAQRVLTDLRMHHLFLGVTGLAVSAGATCAHLGEGSINAAMVEHAARVTVVTSSAKLGEVQLARIAGIHEIDALITDTDADPGQLQQIEQSGVEVTVV